MVTTPSGSRLPIIRAMVFIDGAYLRSGFSELLKHENVDWNELTQFLKLHCSFGGYIPDIIRSYYYDANFEIDKLDSVKDNATIRMHKANSEFFIRVENTDFYEVRIARLKRTEDGNRQKGADVMLSVDMVKKAFEDQYDVAILLAGDDDFLDAVKAVKEAGKRIVGVYFEKHASENLLAAFDKAVLLVHKRVDSFAVRKPLSFEECIDKG